MVILFDKVSCFPLVFLQLAYFMSFLRYGSQTVDPYSRVDLTSAMYAVFLQLRGHFLVFLVIKPRVELAFLQYSRS